MNTITLPRSVVERALNALWATDSEEGTEAYSRELETIKALRAALEQPLTEADLYSIASNYFADEWAQKQAVMMLKDHGIGGDA